MGWKVGGEVVLAIMRTTRPYKFCYTSTRTYTYVLFGTSSAELAEPIVSYDDKDKEEVL